jgi:hypothetical protein
MGSALRSIVDLACTPLARLLVALVMTIGLVILLTSGRSVPDAFWTLTGAVIGFYFGGGTTAGP